MKLKGFLSKKEDRLTQSHKPEVVYMLNKEASQAFQSSLCYTFVFLRSFCSPHPPDRFRYCNKLWQQMDWI